MSVNLPVPISFAQSNADITILAMVLYKEASNQDRETITEIAWTIHNRVIRPCWWGHDYFSVIFCKDQYSSMTIPGDADLIRWPQSIDPAWQMCLDISQQIYGMGPLSLVVDPTSNCTSYYDKSLDHNPPSWSSSPTMEHVKDVGYFHLYRRVIDRPPVQPIQPTI